MMRAPLFRALFRAMPLPTSGGSTSSLTMAERVGKSTALATPRMLASTITCQNWIWLVNDQHGQDGGLDAQNHLHRPPAAGALGAVDHDPGEQGQNGHRQGLGDGDQAERGRRAGQVQDQPRLGRPQQPAAALATAAPTK